MTSTPPPAEPVQTGLSAPTRPTTAYHTWFLGHSEHAGEKPPRGEDEASTADVAAIQAGTQPLPPGAVCIFDVEPAPHGVPRTLYWPQWHFEAYADGETTPRLKGVLSNENHAIPGFVGIQSPDRADGVWQMSSGYRLICGFDPLPFKARFVFWAGFGDNVSEKSEIPWVSQA